MPAISASAPGKVILFGEHAVVYGRPAIAVPVDQVRARAIVTAAPRAAHGVVHLQAPNIELESDLRDLPEEHPLAVVLRGVFSATGISDPPAFNLRVVSTIPVSSGLGSSAAVSVAIIRAVSDFLGRPLSNDQVSALAYEVEILHHGTPSGIDNNVITYARPVYFVRAVGPGAAKEDVVEKFRVARPFTLLIADTGVPSSTATAVGDVRRAWQVDPAAYEALFDAIGDIARSARKAIESGQIDSLGPLMDRNQALLRKIGVSSPELDSLVETARRAGAYGAKLSGGGRGGNMIALARSEIAPAISERLFKSGALNVITNVVR
jgi:mevalonate kinase